MNKATVVVLALTLTALLTGLGYYAYTQNHKTLSATNEVPSAVYDLWTHWKVKNNKKYGTEDGYRLSVFYENYKSVMTHQANPNRTYNKGFTKFMDLTKEEFKAKYLSTHVPATTGNVKVLPTDNLPNSVDWRTKGAVTAVKDQGQCGSCWAFSTTGALEGLSFLSGKGLQSFSEQQLVDCSTSEGNQGCNGGLMDYGFSYVKKNGITSESAYPYTAVDGSCSTKGGAFKIGGYVDVAQGDVTQLASAVGGRPVSIAVDAENWQMYSSGVFSDCSTNLDHGVLLVGYDSQAWIVKNSWGEGWGENGYIRLARGNTCGLANSASYPTA
jgi:C1A family cysteine protease